MYICYVQILKTCKYVKTQLQGGQKRGMYICYVQILKTCKNVKTQLQGWQKIMEF